jgi:ribosomal protein S18 acetylase RimI-like enzyme
MNDKLHFKIRKGELRDAETIAGFNIAMAQETEDKPLDPDTALRGAKAILKDPHKGFYLLAEHKGEIAGQLMTTLEWSDWRNKYFMWIQSVYVPEKFRKQGVYASLYYHLKEIAAERKNVAGIRLYVEKNNTTAKQVYERLGMYDPGYDMYEVSI